MFIEAGAPKPRELKWKYDSVSRPGAWARSPRRSRGEMGDISPCPGAKIRVMTEAEERRMVGWVRVRGCCGPTQDSTAAVFLSCIVVDKELGKPHGSI